MSAEHLTHDEAIRLLRLITEASYTGDHEDCQVCKKLGRFLAPLERTDPDGFLRAGDLLLILTMEDALQ